MLWTVSRIAGGCADKDWEGDMSDSDCIRFLFAYHGTSLPLARQLPIAYLGRTLFELNEQRSQFRVKAEPKSRRGDPQQFKLVRANPSVWRGQLRGVLPEKLTRIGQHKSQQYNSVFCRKSQVDTGSEAFKCISACHIVVLTSRRSQVRVLHCPPINSLQETSASSFFVPLS